MQQKVHGVNNVYLPSAYVDTSSDDDNEKSCKREAAYMMSLCNFKDPEFAENVMKDVVVAAIFKRIKDPFQRVEYFVKQFIYRSTPQKNDEKKMELSKCYAEQLTFIYKKEPRASGISKVANGAKHIIVVLRGRHDRGSQG